MILPSVSGMVKYYWHPQCHNGWNGECETAFCTNTMKYIKAYGKRSNMFVKLHVLYVHTKNNFIAHTIMIYLCA